MAKQTEHENRSIPQMEWIKERMSERGLSVADAARAFETYPNMIWRMLSGQRRVTADEIMQWGAFLDLPPLEALRRFGVHVPSISVPVIGIVRADGRVSDLPGRAEAVEPPTDATTGMAALRVETAQSSLGIWDGAFLYFERATVVRPDAFGRLSVLELGDHAAPIVGVLDRVRIGTGRVTVWGATEHFQSRQLISASPIKWQRAG